MESGDLAELETALATDGKPEKGLGKTVSKWLGKMVGKAAEGTWDIGAETATSLLSDAIKSYLGI